MIDILKYAWLPILIVLWVTASILINPIIAVIPALGAFLVFLGWMGKEIWDGK